MKKIIKPAEKAVCVYLSDFSGKVFGEFDPEVKIKIEFNYGSKYDGTEIELHMTDEESTSLLKHIKEELTEDFKNAKKKELEYYEKQYNDSMQMRDWDFCDKLSDKMLFWREFLDIKEEENES
jgi:hypothetical protein